MNYVVLVGRLTQDPSPKKTQSGFTSLGIRLAVERGDRNRTTDFINCQAWTHTAEFISKYFHKGDPIAIQGQITTRNYDDKNGNKVYVTEVLIEQARFVPNRPAAAASETAPDGFPEAEGSLSF